MRKTIFVFLTIWMGLVMQSTTAAVTITVNPSTTFQTIEGIGGGIVYYLDWLTTHKNKEVLYDTLFNGLGLSGLRIGNWAQEEDADLTYDAEIYHAARNRLGDKCFVLMSSWSAPASLKANGKLSGTNGGSITATLKKENGGYVYDKYGQWWKRSLLQYQKVGVYPDYISIQNEPDCDADYEATVMSGNTTSNIAHYGSALKPVATQIKTLSSPPKILGPEVLGIGWNRVQDYVNHLNKSLLDGYCFHYYHSGLNLHDARELRYSYPDDFLGAMTQLSTDYLKDKPMFMSENSSLVDYHQEMDPINTAVFLSYAFSVNHVASYLHWNLIWGDTGDGCINLEFSEKGYTSEEGYEIHGDYHALRHFSKFISKGWINIDAQTTNSDVIVSAFKSPNSDAYTVVIINRSASAQYIKLPFYPEGMEATVVRSAPKQQLWSSTIGKYTALSDLYPPAYSITTIAYRSKPKKYTYDSDDSGLWTSEMEWTPQGTPSAIDSTIIKRGEVKASGLDQSAPMFVQREGVFRITGDCSFDKIYMQGGSLKSYSSNSLFNLRSNLYIEDASSILVGPTPSSVCQLNGRIYGYATHNLTKTGVGILDIHADASNFDGTWVQTQGTLRISNSQALGNDGLHIEGDTVEILVDAYTNNLRMAQSTTLRLTGATLSVDNATLGDEILPAGTYTNADYPDFITGDGKLIVAHPSPEIVKHGAGASKQGVAMGDSIVDFYYTWVNSDSISVVWNPSQPQGLTVEIDNEAKSIYFSGAPQTTGIFRYNISTITNSYEEAKKSGVISVLDETVGIKNSVGNKMYASAFYLDGTLTAKIVTSKNCTTHIIMTDMLGEIKSDKKINTRCGENECFVAKGLPTGTYLMQIRNCEGMKTLKIVVE